jgi:tetratricopeptide (TPR) repeat protein
MKGSGGNVKTAKIVIGIFLLLSLSIPAMAQEGSSEKCQSLSCYLQSAKIQYQHVYKKSRLRDDLYHCIDLLKEASTRYGHLPEVHYYLGVFYAEINALDTMVAYFDSVAMFCGDPSIAEQDKKNCTKGDNYKKKMADMRQKFWEESYNSAVSYLVQYDTVCAYMKLPVSDDSMKVLDSLKDMAFRLARNDFDMALIAKPGEARTYDALAVLLERQKNYADAITLYLKAMEKVGEDSALVGKIAYAYIYIPDWENARIWFEKYLKFNPNDINALMNLSAAYSALKQYDKWFEYTQRVLELQPDNTQFLFNAGQYWFLKMQESVDELIAITDTTAATKEKREALEGKADEYREKAVQCYRKIIEVDPKDNDARKRLGILLLLGQQAQKAAVVFEEFVALDSLDNDALDYLGRSYIMLGETKAAIRPYELVVKNDPGDVEAWERLEELYRYNAMPDEAEKAQAKVAELKKL